MRKLYHFLFILLFTIITSKTFAQTTYVPDDNFEQALIDLGYDTGDLDDYIPTANISGVTNLDIGNKNISDLTGIEGFVALTQLICDENQLTSLDVSTNTALTGLDCRSNQLTGLNISTNTALTVLACHSNQITSLDVSSNTALTDLYCYSNQLTSLDVSTNTALTFLTCHTNQLSSLNVSVNTALTTLSCGANQLSSLDVSTNTALTYLNSGSNQLTSLDVRNGNNANIYYNSSNNPFLTCIYVDDKTAGYLSGWTKDATSHFVNDEAECLTLMTYVPDDNFEQALIDEGYDSGPLDDYVPTANINGVTILNVDLKNISDLTGIEDFTALTRLSCNINQLSNLDVSANTALTDLSCSSNQLTSLDLSADADLQYLDCSSNQITSLVISSSLDLIWLDCSFNQLSTLNISAHTNLTLLNCKSNLLSGLDISSNTALAWLSCGVNQLSGLDVRNGNNVNFTSFNASSNPDLTCIYVDDKTAGYLSGWTKDATADFLNSESECGTTYVPDDNFEQALIDLGYDTGVLDDYVPTANIIGITNLMIDNKNISDLTGIEGFVALTGLICYSNQLSSLDISTNTALTLLDCSDNQLSILDVSANTVLNNLLCESNQLTSLDLSANTALTLVYCPSNLLSSLDVSANTALTHLTCRNNQLTSLDISANTELTKLYCIYNQLTSLDVRNGNNVNFTHFNASDNPSLTCIYVDDKDGAYISGWTKDATSNFVNDEGECLAFMTYVPDDNFEQALIDWGHDSGDLDNYVATDNINGVLTLNVDNYNIIDLTGIEDFIALTDLFCSNNQLTSLDVSANTALNTLYCYSNQLTSLNISNNTALTKLAARDNLLTSINVSTNNALTYFDCDNNQLSSLDVSANIALTTLNCSYNQIPSMDVSSNTELTQLVCSSNELSSLDVRNGANASLTTFIASSNPDLSCIYVDDKTASYLSDWTIDETSYCVNDEADCSATTSVNEVIAYKYFTIYPNPTKGILNINVSKKNVQKIEITDITGKTVFEKNHVQQNEVVDLYDFANGIYIVVLHTDKGSFSSKIIKE